MAFKDVHSQKINRTICIGLGGTGRDVLMRIRRLIVERHQDFKQLPVISFVHIDTDKATNSTTGLRTGNTFHGVDLRFSDAEKVAATMTRAEVDNFAREITRKGQNYDGSPGVYENISSWFPPQLLKNLKAVDEGAQAIRPVGRLAFFHNYRKIKAAIESAETRTRGHEAFMIRNNWSVDNKLNIFVVGSLCGGTGSGVFLDVAYCLRKMYGNDGAQIAGYFVISPELYGNAPDKSANTYAALKELNYYATMGTSFNADYDLQYLESIEETRPPFEYIYLVSNRTAKDYRILEKSKLCNIIAHKITLDFAGELSPIVTAQRDNFLQHMIQTDEHPRPNVQRYLTFGLAQIYFPRDIAVQVSLNQIKLKLLDFWQQGEGQSADPSNLLNSFLDRWYDRNEDDNGFVQKLEQATTDGSKTFNNALSSWRNRLETNIAEMQNREDRQDVIAQLGREIRSEFRKVQPGETASSRGLWFSSLLKQRERLTTEYIQDINRYVGELLNPNNINFSLTNTRAWLEALTTELNRSYRNLEDHINSLGTPHALETVERKWQDAQQNIRDVEDKRDLFSFRDKQKTSQVQEEAKRIVGQVNKLIRDNYDSALFREALIIVKALQNHVSELTTKASAFSNLLNNVQVAYKKAEDDGKRLDVDDMSGEAIFGDTDTDTCYENLLPESDRAAQLALVSSRITDKIGLGESLASCLERGVIDEQNLTSEINQIVDKMFGSRSGSTVQSAVKRFLESYSISDRSIRLEQIIRESEPLLPLNTSDPYFYNDPGKSVSIIGFKDTDKPEITQFKNILAQNLGIHDSDLKPIQEEDKIILVKEYAAFPLRLIQGLSQMRAHYQRQKTHGKGFLHNDHNTQFIDIIPPDAGNINDLQDIFYSSLAFELLPYNSETKEYELQYHDQFRDKTETTSLSYVWDEALEKLASMKEMVSALDERLNEAIADLTRNPAKWNEYYLPKLRQFVTTVDSLPESHPNYLYKEIVVGTKGGIQKRGQEGIVNRFWKRMQDVVRKAMEEQKQQQQQQKIAGDVQSDHLLTSGDTTNSKPQNKTNKAEVEFASFTQQNHQNGQDTSTQNKPDNNSVLDADYWDSNTDTNSVIDPVFSDTQSDNISVIDGEIDHSDQDLQEIVLKLEKLKKLKAKGIITEDNYKAKEKELLDEML
ncbi:MAG: tubulin-like doman-containing protein [Cyanobacteria bacterium P01_G01_bin.39]